jgi:hypothetical protein
MTVLPPVKLGLHVNSFVIMNTDGGLWLAHRGLGRVDAIFLNLWDWLLGVVMEQDQIPPSILVHAWVNQTGCELAHTISGGPPW